MIKPYLGVENGSTVQGGVNFAVVGATALDAAFFFERGIDNVSTNDSLSVQLGWFKKILPSLCNTSSGKFTIHHLLQRGCPRGLLPKAFDASFLPQIR